MGDIFSLSPWESRNGGRKESALIMERVYNLLHQAGMSVTGQTLVQIRFVSGDILLENDGYLLFLQILKGSDHQQTTGISKDDLETMSRKFPDK